MEWNANGVGEFLNDVCIGREDRVPKKQTNVLISCVIVTVIRLEKRGLKNPNICRYHISMAIWSKEVNGLSRARSERDRRRLKTIHQSICCHGFRAKKWLLFHHARQHILDCTILLSSGYFRI